MLRTRREILQAEVAELTRQLGYVDESDVASEYGASVRRKLILAGPLRDVDAQAIVQDHIEKLHTYNEIK